MPRLKKTAQAEETVVNEQPKEEVKEQKKRGRPAKDSSTPKEEPKTEKPKVEKPKEEPKKESVDAIYPETFTTAKGNVYTRQDDLSWADFSKLVNTGSNFPVRILTKEPERPKVTEFIVSAVLKHFHCIDVSSKDDDYETEVRGDKDWYEAREWFGLPLAVYTVQRPEPKKEEPPKEEVKEEPKKTLKRTK